MSDDVEVVEPKKREFKFIGFTAAGKEKEGTLEAVSLEIAGTILRRAGIFVRTLEEIGSKENPRGKMTTRPNMTDYVFDDIFDKPGDDGQARILPPEPKPKPDQKQDYVKEKTPEIHIPAYLKDKKPAKDVKESCPGPQKPEFDQGQKDALLEDLLRAAEIATFVSENGCGPDLSTKIRFALILEACKRRL